MYNNDLMFIHWEQIVTEPRTKFRRVHRYIASNRLLQNTVIIRALLDPECGRSQLVERDVEYLRVLLPEAMQNRAEARLEADIIIDEKNAVIFYPLRDIGQTTAQDPNSGLNELLATVARIGPRYKVIWLVFEEYSWYRPRITHSGHSIARSTFDLGPNQVQKSRGSTTTAETRDRGRVGQATTIIPASNVVSPTLSRPRVSTLRLDPYAGPVMEQLQKFMAWRSIASDQ
ncbi:hypothetical protein BGZ65_010977, partial [Modicella reniformis]